MRLNFTKIFIAAAIVLAATVTSCKAPQSLAYFENADSLKTVGTTAPSGRRADNHGQLHCAGGNGSLQPSARQSVA